MPRLGLIKEIEKRIKKYSPNTIYTHFNGDLNIDHQIVSQSVLTACRPTIKKKVSKIYAFEVLSSTDYAFGVNEDFRPNHYECINQFVKLKINSLKKYDHEMRPAPHSRSYKNIINLAKLRGSQMYENYAESFVLLRSFS